MTVKFTSNQLFVFKNVKLFLSFTELFDRIIITSYLDKQLFVTVEVDSTDKVFILLNKYYYLGMVSSRSKEQVHKESYYN